MKRLKHTAYALMMLGLLVGPIDAATAAAEAAPEKKASHSLADIIVTSQKREENVQEIPMSITTLSGDELQDAGLLDVWDVTWMSPNVYMANNAIENIIVIRGIAPFNMSLNPACGLYVDDVPLALQHQHNPELYDIERIEILRGPQGALYGRNSESGVINIVTRQPGNELRGQLTGEIGFFDTDHGNIPFYRSQLNISAPVVEDKFAFSLAGQWSASDGYMKNMFNGSDEAARYDHKNFRGVFRWTPDAQWDVTAILDGEKGDDGDGQFRYVSGPIATPRNVINYNDGDGFWNREGYGQSLRVKHMGQSVDFTSITGHRTFNTRYYQDLDLGPYPYGYADMDYGDDYYSQEFRLASRDNGGPLSWLGGVFLFNEDTDAGVDFAAYMQKHQSDWTSNGAAVFGQATYTMLERLHLTLGLRLDYVHGDGDKTFTQMGVANKFSRGFDNTELLSKVAVSYDVTPNIMPYASVSRGYLSGGFAYATAQNADSFVYDPEYTMNYEVGLKTSWLGERLMANVAIFRVNMTDRQVYQQVPGAPATVRVVENVSEAHSQGVEFELRARPAAGLELMVGFGVLEAEIDNWKDTQTNASTGQTETVDYGGKTLPNVPSYTYNIGVMYRHVTGVFGRADLNGVGEIYNNAANSENLKADSYELVNLAVGYEAEALMVSLWSRNLFDQEYYERLNEWTGVGVMGIDGAPRSVGVTVTYRF